MKLALFTRKAHRWGAILIALPFLIVIVTGILLQLKKEWTWVQPATMRSRATPNISLDAMLAATRAVPEAEVNSWADIERIDVQPNRGIAKVQSKNRWEIQLDLATAEVLSSSYRRSDLIESLHDGSWFHDRAKLWIFLPSGVIVLLLWLTGVYLFFLPHWVKWRRRKPAAP